uniref:Transmembrane protein n=1 Tax=Macrostomum lignano TaxID=282301 RepID=A0A1I8G080_9PLAT
MALKRCDRLCNVHGLAKLIFLACITLITCGVIVGTILVPLIILPYSRESRFADANCTYLTEHLIAKLPCESKCSKDKSSFPCYSIRVSISQTNQTGMLYENFITFSERHDEPINQCGTAPCLSQAAENVAMTTRFIRTLRKSRSFPCHYQPASKPGGPTPVLLHRIFSRRQATHCIIWPAVAVAAGLSLLVSTYYCAGCTVWTQDKTVIA